MNEHIPLDSPDPHAGQKVYAAGPAPDQASAFLLMMHGRGSSPQDMLSLYQALNINTVLAAAPQAAGSVWYPKSFLAPIEENQPWLDSALRQMDLIIEQMMDDGFPSRKIALVGFSQGACLVSEYTARHPRVYGGVMALTGGLIGPPLPPGTPRNYPGSLAGTPVFLGTSDPDPHVPFARVQETQQVLQAMGAEVELRRYPGMPHTVNEDELEACRAILRGIGEAKK